MAVELDQELMLEFKAAARQAIADLGTWLGALPVDPTAQERITRLAHQLRGSGGAYGFPAVSTAAGRVEESTRRALRGRVNRLVVELAAVDAAIPASKPASPSPPVVPIPAADRRVRILIAEDDRLTLSLIKDRLERAGHQVDHRPDGIEALDAATSGSYALFVIDVKMPRLDGFGLVQQIRALPRYATTPVLMLTALGGPQDVVRGFQIGVDDYVRKPFSPTELLARIDRLLARPAR